jgi:hypothetical protein
VTRPRDRSGHDRAQSWASIVVGAAVVFIVGWMTVEASGPPHNVKKVAEAGVAAPASAASSAPVTADMTTDGGAAGDLDGGLFLSSLSLGDAGILPTSGPRRVKLGLVFVQFAGAEGAPASARAKKDAAAIAERLGQEAKSDFSHAVSGGDTGSSPDIGWMPRGVLDARTEAAVFALGTSEVSEVLETPRGYWIVKRLE